MIRIMDKDAFLRLSGSTVLRLVHGIQRSCSERRSFRSAEKPRNGGGVRLSLRTLRCIQITFFCLLFNNCFSLPSDQKQILQLSADTADINQETHKGVYKNNVALDQGTTHLRAALAITTVNEKNKLTQATAKGNQKEQAHFWTLVDEKKPPLHAFANTIHYFPEQHLIQLLGNARVEQGQDSFSAPAIHYDTLHKHVVSKSSGQKRTVIIFHPESHHE